MNPSLLRVLTSPCCRADLLLKPTELEGERVIEGSLVCQGCGKAFPITQGIPRFVESDRYTGSFSFEWGIHRRTQFDSERSRATREDFGRKIDLPLDELEGKLVLDAGCGVGRYIDVIKDRGAEIIGADYSYAIDVAQENLSGQGNVHLIQGDLFNLPLRDGLFDYVYSVGVLHHTPDTKQGFQALVKKLAPGGRISIYVYSSYDRLHRIVSRFLRKFTTRLPKPVLYQLCKLAIPMHTVEKIPVLGRLIAVLIPTGAVYEDPQWRVLNTFDWYSPRYQWMHTVEEVFAWFEAEGLEKIRVLPYSVSVSGSKPGPGAPRS